MSFVVGVLFIDLLESAIFRIPRSYFERVIPYHSSLVRMQGASIILRYLLDYICSSLQFIVYFYVLIKYVTIQDGKWWLALTGIIINLLIVVLFFIKQKLLKKQA